MNFINICAVINKGQNLNFNSRNEQNYHQNKNSRNNSAKKNDTKYKATTPNFKD